MREVLEVAPAYGRDYNSVDALLADWNANKDFKILSGPYINKSDLIQFETNRSFKVIKFWFHKHTCEVTKKVADLI